MTKFSTILVVAACLIGGAASADQLPAPPSYQEILADDGMATAVGCMIDTMNTMYNGGFTRDRARLAYMMDVNCESGVRTFLNFSGRDNSNSYAREVALGVANRILTHEFGPER